MIFWSMIFLSSNLANMYSLTDEPKILDFGAGVGNSIPYFHEYFPQADLTCLDVSEKCLAIAERRFPDQATFRLFDGVSVPLEDASFDIVFTACVFHHITANQHIDLITQLHGVLRPGGILVIFEHNPYNPLTVKAVNSCEFDENAVLIPPKLMEKRVGDAGFSETAHSFRIFFPGFLRALRGIEKYMRWLPLGAQYYVVARK